jgi:hypothetical protein
LREDRNVTTDVIPILRVADAEAAVGWYQQLGFAVGFVHRFEPGFPAYVGIRREGAQIHLSEHEGDARPDTLVYLWVDDVDSIATTLGATVELQPWAREIDVLDLDGNRLRIATPTTEGGVDGQLGTGAAEAIEALELAMWSPDTRWDRSWMAAHLTEDFSEFGYSGRSYARDDILDQPVGPTSVSLHDLAVRPVGRDAALVTYRSEEARGWANRSSIWRREGGTWRLAFHQGTPTHEGPTE